MTQADVIAVLQDAIYTVLWAAMPMLATAMIVGLIVSIFQATTQINEQTLAYVPKIIGVLMVLLLFAGTIMTSLESFTIRMFESINTYMR